MRGVRRTLKASAHREMRLDDRRKEAGVWRKTKDMLEGG